MPSIRSLYRVGHKSCFLIFDFIHRLLVDNEPIFDNLPQISNANGPGFYLNTVTLILASQMAIH